MKLNTIEANGKEPAFAEIHVLENEPYGIRLVLRNWTYNKMIGACSFYSGEKAVPTYVESISYEQETGTWVMDYYCPAVSEDVDLKYWCNSKNDFPSITVKVVVDKGSIRTGKDVNAELMMPKISYGEFDGDVDIDLQGAYGNSRSITIDAGASDNYCAVKMKDEDSKTIFEVGHYVDKTIGKVTVKGQGSTIRMNPDKFILNGKVVAVQEITIDGTTYPVLVALP
jgi:hypothetical protein